MSLSQDWDLDTIIQYSRGLNVDEDLAVKKYYQIFRYLRELGDDEKFIIDDCVLKTQEWIKAYASREKLNEKND